MLWIHTQTMRMCMRPNPGPVHVIPCIFCEVILQDVQVNEVWNLWHEFGESTQTCVSDFCFFEVDRNPVPTKTNPLGVKGAGECGTVGALPAVMNAINDALAPLGVRNIAMPCTPDNVWRAIRDASLKAAS